MSRDPRFELLGQPCLTCRGRGGVHLGDCPNDAPRPESAGQQQAAAGVQPAELIADAVYELGIGPEDGPGWHCAIADHLRPTVERIRAEAARPGQELRARVEALKDEWEKRRDWQGITGTTWAADELRAVLEDPR